MEEAGAHFGSPRTAVRVLRAVLAIMRLRNVEADGERLGVVAQHRDHLRQIVVLTIQPADHGVHVELQYIACRASLESRQGGDDLGTGHTVRMRRGHVEPAAIDRRRGRPEAGAF